MTNLQIALISKISFRLLANEKAVIISWLRWVIKWNLIFLKPAIMPYLYLISKQWKLSLVDTFRTLKRCLTGAGRLQECKNTEFVWKLRKMGFCQGGHNKSCPFSRASLRRTSTACRLFIFSFPLLEQETNKSTKFCKTEQPGVGSTQQSFIQGGSTPRSNPNPFIYHFWQKRYPFLYLYQANDLFKNFSFL